MPDLNSVPPSPHVLATSRPTSTTAQSQGQPQMASPSLNILPSNQQAVQQAAAGSQPSPTFQPPSAAVSQPPAPGQDNTGVGPGPGPLRHPRPLTAAELHSELEQEQELLVNRLTRDLTLLRAAQNSSVVSNTSSTSASTSADPTHPSSFTDTHLLSGPGFPIPSTSADRRHHRTSSSTSTRSFSQAATQGSTPAPISIPQPHSGSAASILEAARNPRGAPGMSRQDSAASHRSTSRNRSPHPHHTGSSSYTQSHGFPHDYGSSYFSRTGGQHSSNASVVATPGSELSPALIPTTLRYEETAYFRQELETAKRENEALKRRVRELERTLREGRTPRERRESDVSHGRGRSESTSTTASVSVSGATGVGSIVGGGTGIAGGRRDDRRAADRAASALSIPGSVAIGVSDDEVKVGESATSSGLRT